ncbi:hypothetical protein C438_15161 [Haloferax denitrificans ATCC 35960]|uniref:Uncharacterized protein n=1 Tax=Haloferax denitrificans ATCC 35960 TaxID=662478 RepID=M0IXX0_9EURY|nr:hypothetical protein C438_15161 [Haloferax denitrificans ATCC 35960]
MSRARRETELWRYVEYRCRSCHEWCLVDHGTRAVKMRECKYCARIPAIEDETRTDATAALTAFMSFLAHVTLPTALRSPLMAMTSHTAGSRRLRPDEISDV